LNSISTDTALHGLQSLTHRHRLTLIAGAVVLMAGFGITAVAVAPMVADPTLPVQRVVSQAVVAEGLDEQLAELAAQDITLTRSDVTRATDSADALLARLGVRDPSAAAFLRSDATARQLLAGRGGKMVQAHTDGSGNLLQLVARYPTDQAEQARTHFTRLSVSRSGTRWAAKLQTAPYAAQVRLASGTIRNTLFAATDESGIPDAVSAQLSEIFATDIDFHRELHKGDTFSVVYESLTADGEPVVWNEGAGRVLAAEFVNGGKSHHAVWFAAADGRGAYYEVDGRSKRRSFLASPLEFSRVTSGFAMRFHPLLQKWGAHLGVDYGAPIGTPVRSVADGVVEFAGVQNGYGNVVQVLHGQQRSTLYAHLSRIQVRKGQKVQQGQAVGAVGMTGWSTGPHLHFEFRVAGQHQDPLRLAKATDNQALDSAARQRFAETLQVVKAKLEVAESLGGRHVRED